ncbi:beta-N-acetylglucosaminidase [Bizionia argentinensis JUB59]|uniref:beta-N-acetylhexosaminidase n=1 Tax=Bizionia argentinensis JUB59 TaxID=1046627 RepID=G2E962_9FLAO|nr:glycoside hydrolase family 3 N-terminal domain-containing protein [Bizionia argentinensis]EGV45064.1 beta-N-acetylglucosaminidase [Bizionia argentinensis JUB59]
MRLLFILVLFIASKSFVYAQTTDPLLTPDVENQKKWVDSIYDGFTLDQKIGQLFMVQAFSNMGLRHENIISQMVTNNHIGGIIFSKGDPVSQAKFNNTLQSAAKVPLLIGMDAEWGLSMRLDSTYAFPWNMTLGAIKNNKLVEKAGYHIGEHCRRLGVHFNFAPDIDINTNPKNPIIGNRSFGEDRDNVTEKASAFMHGMHQAGVLSSAKHFPGHGDTDTDSHLALPTIDFDLKRIDSIEIYPYRRLIKEGVSSVMVAHLNVPALEPQNGLPSSLSKHIITDILKEKMGFKGLIFTDALNMKGVANFSSPGDIDLAAFLAGNDILLISEDVPRAAQKLKEAYDSGIISEERLAYSVKKILKAKYKVGLNNLKPVKLDNLLADLNRTEDDALYQKLMENAITVVKNKGDILPIRNLETKKIAYLKLGDDDGSDFLKGLQKYGKVHEVVGNNLDEVIENLKAYNTVIIGFHRSNDNPWKSFAFTNKEMVWLYEIARTNTVILDVFVRPYALLDLKTLENVEGLVVSYQNSPFAQDASAQVIFGAIQAQGSLPVSIGNGFVAGNGLTLSSLSRLGYAIPERVGMSTEKLNKIDAIAQRAVDEKMTPGIQLLVARKGKVIYSKNFGKHTYDKNAEPVKFNDMYDVASLTKILATLPLIMELEEKGIVSLDTKLSRILPDYVNSNKKDITLKQMLSHYARLNPWIPFYFATLDINKRPDPKYYRKESGGKFTVKVANDLYMRSDYQDTIQKRIKDSDLLKSLHYRYSDLPYFILKKYLEKHYDKGMDELVQDRFYQSLGANHTTYNPNNIFSDINIVPTEIDDYYRHQKIQGFVHDMGAAMQGGVGGHAGIFSNANDVAKIMQTFLQKGFYGGKRYFKPETLDKFNTCFYCDENNRRGVGFDKPQLSDTGPTCGCVSMSSFGHSGFTGTYAWADPEEEIVYVFLANRTFPKAGSNTLLRENIRTDIQKLIYEAIID